MNQLLTENGSVARKVLVVDDDPDFREGIRDILRRERYEVGEAGSGEEAIELTARALPDLIILDLHLSGVDGFEVCEAIRQRHPGLFLPIILLSGDALGPQKVRGLEAGAYDFLMKPVTRPELLAKVESFLKMKSLYETVERQKLLLTSLNREQASTIRLQLDKMNQLKRFFSPQVANMIVASAGVDATRLHKQEISICFVDLRGFTAFAQRASGQEVVDVISRYYEVVCGLGLARGGTISSLAGDGVMLFFNDPVRMDRYMEATVRFALEMREGLNHCVADWRQKGYDLSFGAGIAQGESMIGALGFDQFMHYTAISTSVNLAARLCKEAQGGQVLVTQRALRDVGGNVDLVMAGKFQLKGIEQPITAFDLRGWHSI